MLFILFLLAVGLYFLPKSLNLYAAPDFFIKWLVCRIFYDIVLSVLGRAWDRTFGLLWDRPYYI